MFQIESLSAEQADSENSKYFREPQNIEQGISNIQVKKDG
jgi:hypothetical protein